MKEALIEDIKRADAMAAEQAAMQAQASANMPQAPATPETPPNMDLTGAPAGEPAQPQLRAVQ